ncbi:MAG: dienelactone hydrolase family protein, partial [Planctomycetota bacterium]
TDTWNLWHEGHIDPLFQRLIDAYVTLHGVDPDRVYLMGYSAGGDGVYQLAPRMADRFAAAAMMAGHPNESQPLGLRNLPFALFMGGKDAAYDRNAVAARYGARLDELAAADPGGYVHKLTIYPENGHWMDGKDKEALPWMAAFRRDPWPKRVVWLQDDVTHTRFYWLAVPASEAIAGRMVTATVEGQVITLDAPDTKALTLRLSDRLLSLDQAITVKLGGREVFSGVVPRTRAAIEASLAERLDPLSVATALLPLSL